MKASKITSGQISELKISSLPTRPCAPAEFGGMGYTSAQVKEAFDRLPLYIIERFNDLISDIIGEDDESVTDVIKTGISSNHTLKNLFTDITSGLFATYLTVGEKTLLQAILDLEEKLNTIAERVGIEV